LGFYGGKSQDNNKLGAAEYSEATIDSDNSIRRTGMGGNFWSDFLANFLSDLLAGVVLGGILLTYWTRRQEHREQRRSELEKTKRYLEMLKKEIDHLLSEIPTLVGAPQPFVGPEKIRIPTPFWDALQPSGELPKLINPQLLALLTQFYDHLLYAKQGRKWLLSRLVDSDVTKIHSLHQNEIENVIRHGLEQAIQSGGNLPGSLDAEIQSLGKQLAAL
jgi:hypothetical protein